MKVSQRNTTQNFCEGIAQQRRSHNNPYVNVARQNKNIGVLLFWQFWPLSGTTQKNMWGNIWGGTLAKRALGYPKCVQWDQNFWFKIFLILFHEDVYS